MGGHVIFGMFCSVWPMTVSGQEIGCGSVYRSAKPSKTAFRVRKPPETIIQPAGIPVHRRENPKPLVVIFLGTSNAKKNPLAWPYLVEFGL